MQTTKFARKPFYVDAVQVTEENMEQVAQWCQGDVRVTEKPEGAVEEKYIKVRVHRPLTERQTKAFLGDWVLYAGTGFKVYTPRAFEKSFEKVTTLTKKQADEAGIHPPIEKPSPRMLDKPRVVQHVNDPTTYEDDGINLEEVPPLDEKSQELASSADVVFEKDEPDVDYRDAGSGQYVSEEYAEANPNTTVAETEDQDDEEPNPAAEAERILAELEKDSES